MITIVTTSVAVLLMSGLPTDFLTVGSFIAVLGLAMIAAPGAPGGAIMSALPFAYHRNCNRYNAATHD